MILCHNIGEGPTTNYDTLDAILATEGPLSFDGVYESVYHHRHILRETGRHIILFITGDYVGMDNSFDTGQPLEKFCTWEMLFEMDSMGFELGWHTWSHPDLTSMGRISAHQTCRDLRDEIKPPFPMNHFAYPYGKWDDSSWALVKKHFRFGWSTNRGDRLNRFALPRQHCPTQGSKWVHGDAEDFLATSDNSPEPLPDLQWIEMTPGSETQPRKTCTCKPCTCSPQ